MRRFFLSALAALLLLGIIACIEQKREERLASGGAPAPPDTVREETAEPEAAASEEAAGSEEANRPQEAAEERRVIRSSLAGDWYEADPEKLRSGIEELLANVDASPIEGVCALILPHAGYRWSGQTAACAVRQVVGRDFRRVIVIGPTHRAPLENMASIPDATHYVTPLGDVPLDTESLDELRRYPFFGEIPGVHQQEHSVQIEVPLLQHALGSFRLLPIVVGTLDRETARSMARVISSRIDDRTLVVASSDFTHYGPNYRNVPFRDRIAERLKEMDMRAFEVLEEHSAEAFRKFIGETDPSICGREAITLMLELLPKESKAHLLKYDTSGRVSGDYTNSVSYLGIAYSGVWPKAEAPPPPPGDPPELTEKDKEQLLLMARRTIDYLLKEREIPTVDQIGIEPSEAMRWPGAAFVTLEKSGVLRGCIGGTHASRPLYRDVMVHSLLAAFRDQRFPPVQDSELPGLHIEISILTPPRPVASREEIVIGRHGIVMKKGGRSSLFLPQVAPQQGWDLSGTLEQLSLKMGLTAEAWKEGASFLVFEAEVFGEPEKE